MTIIEDSRQKLDKHSLKHEGFSRENANVVRCKLPVGDYCRPPELSVDTKAGVQEIAQNIGGTREEHERFINELKLAKEIGTKLCILVENDEGVDSIDDLNWWINPRSEFSPRAITGERLAKAMHTIEERYGCVFLFCRPEETAETIIDLLRARK